MLERLNCIDGELVFLFILLLELANLILKTAFLKYYRVFNIEDVINVKFDIPELVSESNNYSIEQCDAMLMAMKDRPEIRHKENKA